MKSYGKGTVEYEMGMGKRMLLHACCGPCLLGALSRIYGQYDITVYFYNPNILPKEEFIKRLDALKTVVAHYEGVKLIVPEQSGEEFERIADGLWTLPEGGKRCERCFELRLEKTAEYVASCGEYDCFATTLTVSPHKNAALINAIGKLAGEKYGVCYLASDFKKCDGYLNSTKLSKELGIYRQSYCGCNYLER